MPESKPSRTLATLITLLLFISLAMLALYTSGSSLADAQREGKESATSKSETDSKTLDEESEPKKYSAAITILPPEDLVSAAQGKGEHIPNLRAHLVARPKTQVGDETYHAGSLSWSQEQCLYTADLRFRDELKGYKPEELNWFLHYTWDFQYQRWWPSEEPEQVEILITLKRASGNLLSFNAVHFSMPRNGDQFWHKVTGRLLDAQGRPLSNTLGLRLIADYGLGDHLRKDLKGYGIFWQPGEPIQCDDEGRFEVLYRGTHLLSADIVRAAKYDLRDHQGFIVVSDESLRASPAPTLPRDLRVRRRGDHTWDLGEQKLSAKTLEVLVDDTDLRAQLGLGDDEEIPEGELYIKAIRENEVGSRANEAIPTRGELPSVKLAMLEGSYRISISWVPEAHDGYGPSLNATLDNVAIPREGPLSLKPKAEGQLVTLRAFAEGEQLDQCLYYVLRVPVEDPIVEGVPQKVLKLTKLKKDDLHVHKHMRKRSMPRLIQIADGESKNPTLAYFRNIQGQRFDYYFVAYTADYAPAWTKIEEDDREARVDLTQRWSDLGKHRVSIELKLPESLSQAYSRWPSLEYQLTAPDSKVSTPRDLSELTLGRGKHRLDVLWSTADSGQHKGKYYGFEDRLYDHFDFTVGDELDQSFEFRSVTEAPWGGQLFNTELKLLCGNKELSFYRPIHVFGYSLPKLHDKLPASYPKELRDSAGDSYPLTLSRREIGDHKFVNVLSADLPARVKVRITSPEAVEESDIKVTAFSGSTQLRNMIQRGERSCDLWLPVGAARITLSVEDDDRLTIHTLGSQQLVVTKELQIVDIDIRDIGKAGLLIESPASRAGKARHDRYSGPGGFNFVARDDVLMLTSGNNRHVQLGLPMFVDPGHYDVLAYASDAQREVHSFYFHKQLDVQAGKLAKLEIPDEPAKALTASAKIASPEGVALPLRDAEFAVFASLESVQASAKGKLLARQPILYDRAPDPFADTIELCRLYDGVQYPVAGVIEDAKGKKWFLMPTLTRASSVEPEVVVGDWRNAIPAKLPDLADAGALLLDRLNTPRFMRIVSNRLYWSDPSAYFALKGEECWLPVERYLPEGKHTLMLIYGKGENLWEKTIDVRGSGEDDPFRLSRSDELSIAMALKMREGK